jgi:DNA modification methylase
MLFSSQNILSSKLDAAERYPAKYFPLPEPKESYKTEKGSYSHRNTMNNMSGKEWIKFTRSWFEHHPPPRSKETGEVLHPAKFPEDLIANFIQFFTKQGEWVLDPFLGTGSTLVACDMTKRNGIGVELTEKWAKIAEKRTEQYVIQGDARDIPHYQLPPIDFCISSPPYWDMLNHSRGGSDSTQKERLKKGMDAAFSDNPQDFGNIPDYEGFMIQLLELYRGILEVMKPGKYCAVVMQNTLKQNQEFYPAAWEFALKMRDIGWMACQEFIWCQRDKKLGIWGYPNTYISNVHHHYILIFRKPPENNSQVKVKTKTSKK